MKHPAGYILANDHRSIYIGSTSNLEQRIWKHRIGYFSGHTAKYGHYKLVFYAESPTLLDAHAWERSWKKKTRAKKLALIVSMNPRWNDLAWDWFDEIELEKARAELAEARRRGEIP